MMLVIFNKGSKQLGGQYELLFCVDMVTVLSYAPKETIFRHRY